MIGTIQRWAGNFVSLPIESIIGAICGLHLSQLAHLPCLAWCQDHPPLVTSVEAQDQAADHSN